MKVTCEPLEDSQVLLHIEVEPERAAKSIDDAYRRLANRVSIPGFRKGKAPRHIVERMIGHDALVQEGIDALLPEVFREAVAEAGIQPIDKPQVDVVQEQPLVVNITVPVWPTVALGDYHDVRTEREQVTVREAEVDDVLQQLRAQHAEWLPVERPAAVGDRVTIDVTGHVRGHPVLYDPAGKAILETPTGEPIVEQKGVEYTITPGQPAPVPGFAEELVGLRSGEEKRFELNFPANYPDRELANKAVIFRVKVDGVKERQLPALDDDFAKTVGDYETLESLRLSVRENLQRRAEREAQHRLEERVLNMVADKARIELPPTLVEREIDRLTEQTEHQLRHSNVSLDDYLRVSQKSKEALRADFRADAIANLRRYLVLTEVAKLEDIVVTPDEVDAEVRKITETLDKLGIGRHGNAAWTEPDRREELTNRLRRERALERLVAIATGEATAPSPAASEPAGETQEAK